MMKEGLALIIQHISSSVDDKRSRDGEEEISVDRWKQVMVRAPRKTGHWTL